MQHMRIVTLIEVKCLKHRYSLMREEFAVRQWIESGVMSSVCGAEGELMELLKAGGTGWMDVNVCVCGSA